MNTEIIAFYLPQYHPTPHNNEWWGEGFTEWTNVAKAKKLFPGHYQPKVPADLGFYDLRLPEIRKRQAELAKEAGITGFCYYHYWFGNGHQELELPFNEVVKTGEPDFPFCLCWANESWNRKFWNKDGSVARSETLAEQRYPGEEDNILHFNSLLCAFKDPRYIKYEGKLLFVIYSPLDVPEVQRFMKQWDELALQNGLPGFYFAGHTYWPDSQGEAILEKGYSAVVSCRLNRDKIHNFSWFIRKVYSTILNIPRISSYKTIWPKLITQLERESEKYFPTIMPNWDHTPRSGVKGGLWVGTTPEEFYKHCIDVLSAIRKKQNKICFLKSWNEWGEGNYMEPDLKYGKAYIKTLKKALEETEIK